MKHNTSIAAEYSLIKSVDYQNLFLFNAICFTYSGWLKLYLQKDVHFKAVSINGPFPQ